MESAGITLLKGDLLGMVEARTLSRATYNVAGIPLAAGMLYQFIGLLPPPVVATAALALS